MFEHRSSPRKVDILNDGVGGVILVKFATSSVQIHAYDFVFSGPDGIQFRL